MEKNVGRLQITMHYKLSLNVIYTDHDLSQYESSFFFDKRATSRLNIPSQVATVAKFHQQVVMSGSYAGDMQFDDIWRVDFEQQRNFSLKLRFVIIRLVNFFSINLFQCKTFKSFLIIHIANSPERSFAQFFGLYDCKVLTFLVRTLLEADSRHIRNSI